MSKKNIKRHGRQMRFEEELSSLDDVPSTDTSLNGAAAGIESVGMKETAETSGAEIGEVRKTKKGTAETSPGSAYAAETIGRNGGASGRKTAGAADSGDELYKPAGSCITQTEFLVEPERGKFRRNRKESGQARQTFGGKLRKLAENCDDQLEYFRESVSEMLDSVYALSVKMSARMSTRVRAAHRAHERFRRNHWMQRHLIIKGRAVEKIRDSQFAEVAEALTSFERGAVSRFDRMRMKGHKLVRKYEFFIDSVSQYFIEHRKKCTIAAGTAMMLIVAFAVTINAGTVYNYSYHGTQLGTVKDKTEIEEAVTQIPESVDSDVSVSVDPEVDVTYTKQLDFSANTDTAETVVDKIANADNLTGDGCAIIIDGKTAALVDSEETAKQILDRVKLYYCTEDNEGNKVIDGRIADAESLAAAGTSVTSTEADLSADQSRLDALHDIILSTSVSGYAGAEEEAQGVKTEALAGEGTVTAEAAKGTMEFASASASAADTAAAADGAQTAASAADASVSAEAAAVTAETAQDASEAEEEDAPTAEELAIDAAAAVLTAGQEPGTSAHPLVYSTEITPDDLIFEEDVQIEPVVANVDAFSDYTEASGIFLNEDGSSRILTVSTSEIQIFSRVVPFETVYEEDSSMYEGEKKVKTEGVDGTSRVTAKIYRVNGEEIARDILAEVETEAPVDQVILVGTKEKPSSAPTGDFIMPASGRLSSGFGARWGRTHQGIDIAGSYGSNIVAADGGTVIYAGYNSGGYGYLVKIDHGNGYQTYYGHNSRLLVSVGDKVAQGTVIAKMGSTGRSTGNHCHFEIRKNGVAVNPLSYLN